MSKLRSVIGRPGEILTLTYRFYGNGQSFNPFSITSVKIYDSDTLTNLVATLSVPTVVSIGNYETTWTVPVSQAAGTYFDQIVWQATSDMPTKTQLYSFRITSLQNTSQTDSVLLNKKKESPLFVSDKEIDFFNGINKELIQKIIAQKVIYYAVSDEFSNKNELYGEAIRKTVYSPIEINALVLYNDPLETTTNFSIDTVYSIEVYFHDFELKERNIEPREGDFLKYGSIFYEIKTLTRPQLTFGSFERPVMIKAACVVSRQSNFSIKEE